MRNVSVAMTAQMRFKAWMEMLKFAKYFLKYVDCFSLRDCSATCIGYIPFPSKARFGVVRLSSTLRQKSEEMGDCSLTSGLAPEPKPLPPKKDFLVAE